MNKNKRQIWLYVLIAIAAVAVIFAAYQFSFFDITGKGIFSTKASGSAQIQLSHLCVCLYDADYSVNSFLGEESNCLVYSPSSITPSSSVLKTIQRPFSHAGVQAGATLVTQGSVSSFNYVQGPNQMVSGVQEVPFFKWVNETSGGLRGCTVAMAVGVPSQGKVRQTINGRLVIAPDSKALSAGERMEIALQLIKEGLKDSTLFNKKIPSTMSSFNYVTIGNFISLRDTTARLYYISPLKPVACGRQNAACSVAGQDYACWDENGGIAFQRCCPGGASIKGAGNSETIIMGRWGKPGQLCSQTDMQEPQSWDSKATEVYPKTGIYSPVDCSTIWSLESFKDGDNYKISQCCPQVLDYKPSKNDWNNYLSYFIFSSTRPYLQDLNKNYWFTNMFRAVNNPLRSRSPAALSAYPLGAMLSQDGTYSPPGSMCPPKQCVERGNLKCSKIQENFCQSHGFFVTRQACCRIDLFTGEPDKTPEGTISEHPTELRWLAPGQSCPQLVKKNVSSSVQENCTNEFDDDRDYLIDCGDPDCAQDSACLPTLPHGREDITMNGCNDGIDNDEDGYIDCNDTDCKWWLSQSQSSVLPLCPRPRENCTNGIDDNDNSLIDCDDSDCNKDPACHEQACNDGIDNDNDGYADCDDPDCFGKDVCIEKICNDGIDNDNDGYADCDDPDCFGKSVITGCGDVDMRENILGSCDDDVDNDLDRLIDCDDPDCEQDPACN